MKHTLFIQWSTPPPLKIYFKKKLIYLKILRMNWIKEMKKKIYLNKY